MKLTAAACIAIAGLSAPALAGTLSEVETINFDIQPGEFESVFSVQGFNTMGGTRQLDRILVGLGATLTTEIIIDNESDFEVPSGTWQYLPGHVNFFQIDDGSLGGGDEELGGDGGGGNSIFFGLGGPAFDGITATLGADDDVEPGPFPEAQPDGPDAFVRTYTGSFNSLVADDAASTLSFLSDAPPLTGRISPFTFPEIFHPSNGANLSIAENVAESGPLTITYEYSIIPAPGAGVLMLGGLGLIARRRR